MTRFIAAATAGAICTIISISNAAATPPIPQPRPEYPPPDTHWDRISCLAKAVYFEARGEPESGQRMVAEVVLNRVQSPYYPHTICEVVYQNDHLRNACQFSFACDGIPDTIKEPEAYKKAREIAIEALDCDEKCRAFSRILGRSTHYHADWVSPSWADKLYRTGKFGRHIFYYTSTM
jgi:spore germination cell wall hydrolase CwlJ-like protein